MFAADEDRPGAPRVAILTSGLWRTGTVPTLDVLDRPVFVDRVPTRIVGVLVEHPGLPTTADVWLPLSAAADAATARRDSRALRFGRLQDSARFANPARTGIESMVERSDASIRRRAPASGRASCQSTIASSAGSPIQHGWPLPQSPSSSSWSRLANVANLILDRSLRRTRELRCGRRSARAGSGSCVSS